MTAYWWGEGMFCISIYTWKGVIFHNTGSCQSPARNTPRNELHFTAKQEKDMNSLKTSLIEIIDRL